MYKIVTFIFDTEIIRKQSFANIKKAMGKGLGTLIIIKTIKTPYHCTSYLEKSGHRKRFKVNKKNTKKESNYDA